MDLFSSSVSDSAAHNLTALLRSSEQHLTYQSWQDYQQSLADTRIASLLQQTTGQRFTLQKRQLPVTPQRGFMTLNRRGFASQQPKEKI
jgi:hypothetical protein